MTTYSGISSAHRWAKPNYIGVQLDIFPVPHLRRSAPHWEDFIKNGGHIRLVTSVELSEGDLRAIENGAVKQDVCAQRIEQIIENDFADGDWRRGCPSRAAP